MNNHNLFYAISYCFVAKMKIDVVYIHTYFDYSIRRLQHYVAANNVRQFRSCCHCNNSLNDPFTPTR